MSEQVNNIVDTTQTEVPTQVQQQTKEPEKTPSTEPESVQEVNWRLFRETREKERKQREELDRKAREKEQEAIALKAALDAIVNKPTHSPSYEQNEETEQDRIRKEVDRLMKEKEVENERKRTEREHQEMPQKLATVYTDFNRVCTADNIDYLEFHYPEVAEAYKHMPDSFDKWSNVYKAIKRFVPNTDSKKDQARADKNFSKPQAISKPGATPTGDSAPIHLDDKRRNDNWRRMQKVMKGV